jgi:hypothetical protein
MRPFPKLVAYNRQRSLNSYDSAIDGAVPEVFGAKSAGEPFLQFMRPAALWPRSAGRLINRASPIVYDYVPEALQELCRKMFNADHGHAIHMNGLAVGQQV